MGLQGVELVMDVEDAFGIQIPDDVASEVRTVGQLNGVVLSRLSEKAGGVWPSRAEKDGLVW